MRSLLLALILAIPSAAAAWHNTPKANVADRTPPKDADAPIVLTTSAPNFCIFGGQSGKSYSGEAAFSAVVWRSDVVYVGETHDQPLDHLAQLEALKAMKIARGSRIAVGFEMLDQTRQPVLDDYVSGKIGEAEFLAKTDWRREWGFDFALYRPLFDFIRQNGLKALALNVPRAVVEKIARSGLDALTPDEKKYLPADLKITKDRKYNEYLESSYGGHDGPMAKVITFGNYKASMAAWNEGMGARIADFLAGNPGYEVLVVAGNGHLMYNAGLQASVRARVKGVRQASFYTGQAEKCPEKLDPRDKGLAGYIWYIDHPAKPEAPEAAPTAAMDISTAAAAQN